MKEKFPRNFFSLFNISLFMVANKNGSGGRTTCRSIKDQTGNNVLQESSRTFILRLSRF
jgi:hypothetical protein